MIRFVAYLVTALLAALAHADDPRVHRIAFADASSPVSALNEQSPSPNIRAFFDELHKLGYVEGMNIVIDRYSGEGKAENLPVIARKIVDTKPEVVIGIPGAVARAVKAVTDEIPIVALSPPPGLKFITDLDRPGGNFTGVVEIAGDAWGMRFAVLKEVVPSLSKIGVLGLRAQSPYEETMTKAAREDGIVTVAPLLDDPADEAQYRRAFNSFSDEHVDALLVSDAFQLAAHRALITDLATKAKIPTMYPYSSYVDNGGLISLALDFPLGFRHVARYVDRILKGARPGDLAFVRLDSHQMIVSEKAARAIGLAIPDSVRSRAIVRD